MPSPHNGVRARMCVCVCVCVYLYYRTSEEKVVEKHQTTEELGVKARNFAVPRFLDRRSIRTKAQRFQPRPVLTLTHTAGTHAERAACESCVQTAICTLDDSPAYPAQRRCVYAATGPAAHQRVFGPEATPPTPNCVGLPPFLLDTDTVKVNFVKFNRFKRVR
jgi:hypothetical protein